MPGSSGSRASDRVGWIDLSADDSVTTTLLSRPLDWRVRVVEHLDLETASSCLRRRSLQAAPLRPLLPESVADSYATALVVLNVASVPRGALVDLDLLGPDEQPAFLLPRAEIARLEAEYLTSVAREADLEVDAGVRALLIAVLGHTTTRWELGTNQDPLIFAADYLSDGFGRPIPDDVLASWTELDTRIAGLLQPHADNVRGLSACEHPLLGLPALGDLIDPLARDWHTMPTAALRGYLELLEAATLAARPDQPSAAKDLLAALADYGRNYDMLVAVMVPLDEPFLVKYSERRHMTLSANGAAEQDLVINDAGSNHLVMNVLDPNVRIREVEALTAGLPSPAYGAFTTRQTPQTYAIYAYQADRDFRITLQLRLAPLRRLQYASYVAAGLLVLLAAGLAYEHPRRLQDLALIVGPSSLAASVLLTREPTTLSARLRTRSNLVVSIALLILVLIATLSYLWPALVVAAGMVQG